MHARPEFPESVVLEIGLMGATRNGVLALRREVEKQCMPTAKWYILYSILLGMRGYSGVGYIYGV